MATGRHRRQIDDQSNATQHTIKMSLKFARNRLIPMHIENYGFQNQKNTQMRPTNSTDILKISANFKHSKFKNSGQFSSFKFLYRTTYIYNNISNEDASQNWIT